MVLEPAVHGGADAVVALAERLEHHVGDARVVEAGKHDERLEADVRVGVAVDGFDQRRHGDGRVGAPVPVRAASMRMGKSTDPSRSIADLSCAGVTFSAAAGPRAGVWAASGRAVEQRRQRGENEVVPGQKHRKLVDRLQGELKYAFSSCGNDTG